MSAVVVVDPDELRALVREAVRDALSGAAPDEVLTREEAAKLLDVHPNVLSRWVRERGVPARKLGSHWRFRRSELLQWLDKQRSR